RVNRMAVDRRGTRRWLGVGLLHGGLPVDSSAVAAGGRRQLFPHRGNKSPKEWLPCHPVRLPGGMAADVGPPPVLSRWLAVVRSRQKGRRSPLAVVAPACSCSAERKPK